MSKRRRGWLIAGAIAGIVLITAGAVATYIANNFEPVVRKRIIAELEHRFDSSVQLDKINISAIPRLHVVGHGLTLKLNRYPTLPPLVHLDEFSFRVEWQDLTGSVRHINAIHLKGFELNMPPRSQQQPKAKPEKFPQEPTLDENASGSSLIVDQIIADKTMLRLLPREPEKPPKEFELMGLRIYGAGQGRPMNYSTKLRNYKPPGIIDSDGQFGPWNASDPSDSPLSGTYEFTKADLGVFKGIAGTLHSTGKFGGTLGRIDVDGETDTPDFQIRLAGHKVPLKTKFHAVVDGTSGNTILDPVEAKILNTAMTVTGSVVGERNVKGKIITFDVLMRNGRLEDLMQLAVKGRPPMSGAVTLKTKLHIPREDVDVIEKLGLNGTFQMSGARFADPQIQGKIDEFSRRAQGHPGDMDIAKIKSRMAGNFVLSDTVLRMSKLFFAIEGAEVDMAGHYGLRSEEIDFDGVMRMDAKASQAFGGMKSLLLRPFDSLVSRRGRGTVLSLSIEGKRSEPKFAVDWKRTLKKTDN